MTVAEKKAETGTSYSTLESFVGWRIFSRIKVGFLHASHTSEAIHRAFSNISELLRSQSGEARARLCSKFRDILDRQVTVIPMKSVASWSRLCHGHFPVFAPIDTSGFVELFLTVVLHMEGRL